MPTKNSLMTYQGVPDAAEIAAEYGDRLEGLSLWEKTSFLTSLSGWLMHCACTPDWLSFFEYEMQMGALDPSAHPMIAEHFDYVYPKSALPLVFALTHQLNEGCYEPDEEGFDKCWEETP